MQKKVKGRQFFLKGEDLALKNGIRAMMHSRVTL